ncbi:hypothetical protein [Caulobacter flavus]|nr:hypothetical protein [Caulobacter flavus]
MSKEKPKARASGSAPPGNGMWSAISSRPPPASTQAFTAATSSGV